MSVVPYDKRGKGDEEPQGQIPELRNAIALGLIKMRAVDLVSKTPDVDISGKRGSYTDLMTGMVNYAKNHLAHARERGAALMDHLVELATSKESAEALDRAIEGIENFERTNLGRSLWTGGLLDATRSVLSILRAVHPNAEVLDKKPGELQDEDFLPGDWLRAGFARAGVMTIRGILNLTHMANTLASRTPTGAAAAIAEPGLQLAGGAYTAVERSLGMGVEVEAQVEPGLAPAGHQPTLVDVPPNFGDNPIEQLGYEIANPLVEEHVQKNPELLRLAGYARRHPYRTMGGEVLGVIGLTTLFGGHVVYAALAAEAGGGIGAWLATSALASGEILLTMPGTRHEVLEEAPATVLTTFALGGALHAAAPVLRGVRAVAGATKISFDLEKFMRKRAAFKLSDMMNELFSAESEEHAAKIIDRALRTVGGFAEEQIAGLRQTIIQALSTGDRTAVANIFESAISAQTSRIERTLRTGLRGALRKYGLQLPLEDARKIAAATAEVISDAEAAGVRLRVDTTFFENAVEVTERELEAAARAHGEMGGKRVKGRLIVKLGASPETAEKAILANISLALNGRPGAAAKVFTHELAHLYVETLRWTDPERFSALMAEMRQRMSIIAGEEIPEDQFTPDMVAEAFVKVLTAAHRSGYDLTRPSSSQFMATVEGFGRWMAEKMRGIIELRARLLGGAEEGEVSEELHETMSDFANGRWTKIFAAVDELEVNPTARRTVTSFMADADGESASGAVRPVDFTDVDVVSSEQSGEIQLRFVKGAPATFIRSLAHIDFQAQTEAIVNLLVEAFRGNDHEFVKKVAKAREWYYEGRKAIAKAAEMINGMVDSVIAEMRRDGYVTKIGDEMVTVEFDDDLVADPVGRKMVTDKVLAALTGHSAARRGPLINFRIAMRALAQHVIAPGRPLLNETGHTVENLRAVARLALESGIHTNRAPGEIDAAEAVEILARHGIEEFQHVLRAKKGSPIRPKEGEKFIDYIRRMRFGSRSIDKLYEYGWVFLHPEDVEAYVADTWELQGFALLPDGMTQVYNDMWNALAEGDLDRARQLHNKLAEWHEERRLKRQALDRDIGKVLARLHSISESFRKRATEDISGKRTRATAAMRKLNDAVAKGDKAAIDEAVQEYNAVLAEDIDFSKVLGRKKLSEDQAAEAEDLVKKLSALVRERFRYSNKPMVVDPEVPGRTVTMPVNKELYESARMIRRQQVAVINQKLRQILGEEAPQIKLHELQAILWFLNGGGRDTSTGTLVEGMNLMDVLNSLGEEGVRDLIKQGLYDGWRAKKTVEFVHPFEGKPGYFTNLWGRLMSLMNSNVLDSRTKTNQEKFVKAISGPITKRLAITLNLIRHALVSGHGYWMGDASPNVLYVGVGAWDKVPVLGHFLAAVRFQSGVYAAAASESAEMGAVLAGLDANSAGVAADVENASGVILEVALGKNRSSADVAERLSRIAQRLGDEHGVKIDGATIEVDGGRARIWFTFTTSENTEKAAWLRRLNDALDSDADLQKIFGEFSDPKQKIGRKVWWGEVYYKDFGDGPVDGWRIEAAQNIIARDRGVDPGEISEDEAKVFLQGLAKNPNSRPEAVQEIEQTVNAKAEEAYGEAKGKWFDEIENYRRKWRDAKARGAAEEAAEARRQADRRIQAWHVAESLRGLSEAERERVVRDYFFELRTPLNLFRHVEGALKKAARQKKTSFTATLVNTPEMADAIWMADGGPLELVRQIEPGLVTDEMLESGRQEVQKVVRKTFGPSQESGAVGPAGKRQRELGKWFHNIITKAMGLPAKQQRSWLQESMFFEVEEGGDAYERAAQELVNEAMKSGSKVEQAAARKAAAAAMRSASRAADADAKEAAGKVTPTDEELADPTFDASPSARLGFIRNMRIAIRNALHDRFAHLEVVDSDVANRFAMWASVPTRRRVWAVRQAQYVTEGANRHQIDLFVRYGMHVRREAILASEKAPDPADINLPELTPAELEEVKNDPVIQEMIRRWRDEVWPEVLARRKALGLQHEQQVYDDFFMSIIPYDESIHGKDVRRWAPPSKAGTAAEKFHIGKTKFRLRATGTAESYLTDPADILYYSTAPDDMNYEMATTLETLKAKGLVAEDRPPDYRFIDQNGKEHPWRPVTVRLPSVVYDDVKLSKKKTVKMLLGRPGKRLYMPAPVADAWEDLVLRQTDRFYRSWMDNVLFRQWAMFNDKVTGFALMSFVEAMAHSQRVLGQLAGLPPVGAGKVRIAELLAPYVGPRLGALWRIYTAYTHEDSRLLEQVMARIGAFPSRSIANEQPVVTGTGKVANAALGLMHKGRGFLFDLPEQKRGFWGFDVRARVVALRLWYEQAKASGRLGGMTLEDLATKPSPFDAEIRDFLAQFGAFNNELQGNLIRALKASRLNPFAAAQGGMRPGEIKQLFGFSGLKGRNAAESSFIWAETLYRHTIGPLVFHALANKALSGHWPWENEPGKEMDLEIGLKDDDGAPIFISSRILYPGLTRALRTTGLRYMFDERWGVTLRERMGVLPNRMVNEAIGAVTGPGVKMLGVGLTGRVPFMGADWKPMQISRPRLDPMEQAKENIKAMVAVSNPNLEAAFDDWLAYQQDFENPALRYITRISQFFVGKAIKRGKNPLLAGGEAVKKRQAKIDDVSWYYSNRFRRALLAGRVTESLDVLTEAAEELQAAHEKGYIDQYRRDQALKRIVRSAASGVVSAKLNEVLQKFEEQRLKKKEKR